MIGHEGDGSMMLHHHVLALTMIITAMLETLPDDKQREVLIKTMTHFANAATNFPDEASTDFIEKTYAKIGEIFGMAGIDRADT